MGTIESADTLMSDAAQRVLAGLGMIAAMVLATAAGAQVVVPLPFTPVPFTLQVFAVLLTGLLLSPYKALIAQSVYVGLGLSGVPWFAGLSSLPLRAAMGAETFGYLAGFILAAPVVAHLRGYLGSFGAASAGLAVIYLAGATHLAFVLNVDASKALTLGVLPFLPLDAVKAVLAVRVAGFMHQLGRAPRG